MTIKNKIVSTLLQYLWVKYPNLMRDIVIGEDMHLHRNPRKKKEVLH